MHAVLTGLLRSCRQESQPESGVVVRQERDGVVAVIGRVPAEETGPEPREAVRVIRVEAERDELGRHPRSPIRRSPGGGTPGRSRSPGKLRTAVPDVTA
jgi:hypothetical protein